MYYAHVELLEPFVLLRQLSDFPFELHRVTQSFKKWLPFNSHIVLQGHSTNYNTQQSSYKYQVGLWTSGELLGVISLVSSFSHRHSPDKQRKDSSRCVVFHLAGLLKVKTASSESGLLWTVSVIFNSSSSVSFLG